MKRISVLLVLPWLLIGKSHATVWTNPKNTPPPSNTTATPKPKAFNDTAYIVPDNKIPGNTIVEGKVTENDFNGNFVELVSNPIGKYGYLLLNSNGEFKYNLFDNSPKISGMKAGDLLTEDFIYRYINNKGKAVKARLTIKIIGNPLDEYGNTIFDSDSTNEEYDNVDVEFNDFSWNATQVNSGRTIKGHLYSSSDKDWYALSSAGNEIIDIELCPKGSVCYDKKNWVVYIFDSEKLTQNIETATIGLEKWIDAGYTQDDAGATYPLVVGQANHMYLLYRGGIYSGALVGVIDPCFGSGTNSNSSSSSRNSVSIGVGPGAKNYLMAVSSPLLGDESESVCGAGSVILTRPDNKVQVNAKSEDTTREFISAFPYSDDQYAIKITGTGLKPLE
jgi:VCBS repeat-containing protein